MLQNILPVIKKTKSTNPVTTFFVGENVNI